MIMKQYIGTKIVQAQPAIRKGGRVYLETDPIPKTMEQLEEGYKVIYKDGYESWSPKATFEEAYRPADSMNFGLAIEACKMGKRITRTGWNGKGMFVVYQKGYPDGIPCNEQTAKAFGYEPGTLFKCRPYLQMRCADGTHQMWLASQSDILADDWQIVE
jgi:hypothetical protein